MIFENKFLLQQGMLVPVEAGLSPRDGRGYPKSGCPKSGLLWLHRDVLHVALEFGDGLIMGGELRWCSLQRSSIFRLVVSYSRPKGPWFQ